MALKISTTTTQMQPAFIDGKMLLGSVVVVVNFGSGGSDYFGGQVMLTHEDDGISFTSTEKEIQELAIAKAKSMIETSELPTPPEPQHEPEAV